MLHERNMLLRVDTLLGGDRLIGVKDEDVLGDVLALLLQNCSVELGERKGGDFVPLDLAQTVRGAGLQQRSKLVLRRKESYAFETTA